MAGDHGKAPPPRTPWVPARRHRAPRSDRGWQGAATLGGWQRGMELSSETLRLPPSTRQGEIKPRQQHPAAVASGAASQCHTSSQLWRRPHRGGRGSWQGWGDAAEVSLGAGPCPPGIGGCWGSRSPAGEQGRVRRAAAPSVEQIPCRGPNGLGPTRPQLSDRSGFGFLSPSNSFPKSPPAPLRA